jgi:hypothetical protein
MNTVYEVLRCYFPFEVKGMCSNEQQSIRGHLKLLSYREMPPILTII